MKTEVLLPLVGYLVLVFAISIYAFRRRKQGNFLNEFFLGGRSMGGFVLAMTLTTTYVSASSFIGGSRCCLQIWAWLGASGHDSVASYLVVTGDSR